MQRSQWPCVYIESQLPFTRLVNPYRRTPTGQCGFLEGHTHCTHYTHLRATAHAVAQDLPAGRGSRRLHPTSPTQAREREPWRGTHTAHTTHTCVPLPMQSRKISQPGAGPAGSTAPPPPPLEVPNGLDSSASSLPAPAGFCNAIQQGFQQDKYVLLQSNRGFSKILIRFFAMGPLITFNWVEGTHHAPRRR
jgi:hypothetical protein